MAYLHAAEMGMEVGQSNAAWMLVRGYGAKGAAASALAMRMHQRAAGQVLLLDGFQYCTPALYGWLSNAI